MTTMLAVVWKKSGRKGSLALALLGFLTVSMPFIAALSWNQHRFTFGGSGSVNRGWLVNRAANPTSLAGKRTRTQGCASPDENDL